MWQKSKTSQINTNTSNQLSARGRVMSWVYFEATEAGHIEVSQTAY